MMTSATPFYSSSPSKQITVIDVYDLAESINRDFEILAEKYGNDPFESIVRKVLFKINIFNIFIIFYSILPQPLEIY